MPAVESHCAVVQNAVLPKKPFDCFIKHKYRDTKKQSRPYS